MLKSYPMNLHNVCMRYMAFVYTFRNPKHAISLMRPKIKHDSQFLNTRRLHVIRITV